MLLLLLFSYSMNYAYILGLIYDNSQDIRLEMQTGATCSHMI